MAPRTRPLSFSSIKVGALPPVQGGEATRAAAAPEELAVVDLPAAAPSTSIAPAETPAAPAPVVAEPQPPAPLAAPLEPAAVIARIDEPSPDPTPIYWIALLASLLWTGAIIGLGLAYESQSRGGLNGFAVGAVALLALGPLAFVWAGAFAVLQARRLSHEAERARRLTNELIGPTALAAAQSGAVVEAMRGQIATAAEVANQARAHLGQLREALEQETERLAEATAQASHAAIHVVETLSRERGELTTLALTLDARASAVTDAINRQVRMVAEASDLAETNLREAEASLAGRAADLAAAAGEAVDASRVAADDLGRQIERLETAGAGVGDQMQALEAGLTEQRAALVTVAHALRAEQEDFATLAESRTAQLSDFIGRAQSGVAGLNEATTRGAQSLSQLIEAAGVRFRELADAAHAERDAFAQSAEDALRGLSDAGARERDHLELAMRSTIEALSAAANEAREAADVHAEAARARVDQLNEAAFSAGQKADEVFEARLAEARGLIEHSAKLIETASEEAARRLEDQVAGAREAFDGLNGLIEQVAERAARVPDEAAARAEAVKAAMERNLEALLATARKAAEETQAIDAAFQERVRRNYEMLSEAVQLMGVVAQGGQGAAGLQRPSPAERVRARLAQPPPAEPVAEPAPAESTREVPKPPTATDDEFAAAIAAATGQAGSDDSGWTWKELLSSAEGAADGAELGEALYADIGAMGIDPGALLPRARIDEIAAAMQTGDAAGAREVVRALAPAAMRRLARRLLSDTAFRGRAQAFTRRYAEVLADAAKRDRQGYQEAALLATTSGRAYLLLDAAAGQPG